MSDTTEKAADGEETGAGAVLKLVSCNNCRKCLEGKTTESGWPVLLSRMVVCPNCGDKRCPKAEDHQVGCTASDERVQSHKGQVLSLKTPAANAAIRMSAEVRMLIGMAKEHVEVVKAAQSLMETKGLPVEATQLGLLAKTFEDILHCVQTTDKAVSEERLGLPVSPDWQPHLDMVTQLAVERRCEELTRINESLEAKIDRLEAAEKDKSAPPELTSRVVSEAAWKFIEAMPHELPGRIFNDLKPAVHAAICRYHQMVANGEMNPHTNKN